MSRLAEYFCIIGVADTSDLAVGKEVKGTILQRFPDHDHKEFACPQGLEWFCAPNGWSVVTKPALPSFYVAVLTDMEGHHNYSACLIYYEIVEAAARDQNRPVVNVQSLACADDANEKLECAFDETLDMYVPKCLCLVARHRYFSILKNCLSTLFVAYISKKTSLLEKMVGCLLSFVHVPPAGGPKLTFSIGGGDRQVLQPPMSSSIPATHESVAVLFNQLGIRSMMLVFRALITENKILILSSSYSHLTMAAEACISLLYPMSFSYVYIPILPSALLDFLNAPTPFLMGVHTSYAERLPELFDVVLVNIDEGYVHVPDSIHLATIPQPYYSRMLNSLKLILSPALYTADVLFKTDEMCSHASLALQDKQLRSVFVRLFAEMFCGYRSCLTLIRLHPKPVISFNKAAFMEKRGLVGHELFNKVLESIAFSSMIQVRGPPFRTVDMFDELVASIELVGGHPAAPILASDAQLVDDLHPIISHLWQNEPDLDERESEDIPSVSSELLSQPIKPLRDISAEVVQSYMPTSGAELRESSSALGGDEPSLQRVPVSPYDHQANYFVNQRRLEVLKDCISFLFDNKISEARKIMPSVLRALKSRGAQLALCYELELRVKQGSTLLEHDQYNLIIRLFTAALQDESSVGSAIVASALLPLITAFHRKLGPSVAQFCYTSIQDHAVWNSVGFWEEAFYTEVQKQVIELHMKEHKKKLAAKEVVQNKDSAVERVFSTPADGKPFKSHLTPTLSDPATLASALRARSSSFATGSPDLGYISRLSLSEAKETPKDQSDAMDLAAALLSEWEEKSMEEKNRLIYEEETIVYSLAMLYSQRMMFLRVPINAYSEIRKRALREKLQRQLAQQAVNDSQSPANAPEDGESLYRQASHLAVDGASTAYGGSAKDSSSEIASTYAGDYEVPEDSTADNISKFILRFVERVCVEAGISASHLKTLHNQIPVMVHMHIESLEEVYRETRNLAPNQKAKIMKPALLSGETVQYESLRCYLVPDGSELGVRSEGVYSETAAEENYASEMNKSSDIGGPCLLPAEGAIFLTNYRVIFKGYPVDQFASEMAVTRAFPVGSLINEKKVTGGRFVIGRGLFSEECWQLRSATFQVWRLCFDQDVGPERLENFRRLLVKLRWPPSVQDVFAFSCKSVPTALQRSHSRNQMSLKKANLTLSSVANLAKKKTVSYTGGSFLRKQKQATTDDSSTRVYKPVANGSPTEALDGMFPLPDATLEKADTVQYATTDFDALSEFALCKEYERLGFGALTKPSTSNSHWRLSLANLHYNLCRSYPSVLVLPEKVVDDALMKTSKNYRQNRIPVAVWRHRRTKGVLLRSGAISKSMLAAAVRGSMPGVGGISQSTLTEDEQLFAAIVAATSLVSHKGKYMSVSAGVAKSLEGWVDPDASVATGSVGLNKYAEQIEGVKSWTPAELYIFCDKAATKGTRIESSRSCCVVNVEVHDAAQLKVTFSKLLKACCPNSSQSNATFLKRIEDSKWLQQVSSLLQLASTISSLIDIQGSSCLVSFGDGWDVTAQVVSLVQILSDPFYRTIDGFCLLIEKDWLAFGYRFSHRANMLMSQRQSNTTVAPVFLQFLDCVYQLLVQFPHAFEFSEFFVRFLAFHHVSMRFNTFLLDSEYERCQHGLLGRSMPPDDAQIKLAKKQSAFPKFGVGTGKKGGSGHELPKDAKTAQSTIPTSTSTFSGVSIWDYIDVHCSKFTVFQNFKYQPSLQKGPLAPFCACANLEVWEYYTDENLYTSPVYDLELMSDFEMENPTGESSSLGADVEREDFSRCLTGCYGSTLAFPRHETTYLLNELNRLKDELDQQTQMWHKTWSELDVQDKRQSRQLSWKVFWAKDRVAVMHKHATVDMVTKGKLSEVGELSRNDFGFEHPHQFIYHNYLTATSCNYCLSNIWGLGTGLQCTQCGYNVHDKCQSMVPSKCQKSAGHVKHMMDMSRSAHSLHATDKPSGNPKNFKGTLFKRSQGRLIRQWKPRWFVLDVERNQLTYYDSEADSQLQGHIELADMRGCQLIGMPPGPPKGADPLSFFQVETTRRCFVFMATSPETARDWVDRLNALNV